MNIDDTRSIVLLNLDAEDLLTICTIDKLSYKICSNKQFQTKWFNYNDIEIYEIDDMEEFIDALNTLIKIDKVLDDINQDKVYQSAYTNGNIVKKVEINKEFNHWRVKHTTPFPYGKDITKTECIRDIKKLRRLLFNVINFEYTGYF